LNDSRTKARQFTQKQPFNSTSSWNSFYGTEENSLETRIKSKDLAENKKTNLLRIQIP
jgi:hypothetical protein